MVARGARSRCVATWPHHGSRSSSATERGAPVGEAHGGVDRERGGADTTMGGEEADTGAARPAGTPGSLATRRAASATTAAGARSSRPSTRAASSMSSMGRAMTSSAPASRSAMRSSTESVWARASTGTAARRGSAFSRATTSVASMSGVRSTTTRLASTARSRADGPKGVATTRRPRPARALASRAASARSAHRSSSDRSDGFHCGYASRSEGQSGSVRWCRYQGRTLLRYPAPSDRSRGSGTHRWGHAGGAAILRPRPFSSAVRAPLRPTQPERGISHGKEHEYPCVAMS